MAMQMRDDIALHFHIDLYRRKCVVQDPGNIRDIIDELMTCFTIKFEQFDLVFSKNEDAINFDVFVFLPISIGTPVSRRPQAPLRSHRHV